MADQPLLHNYWPRKLQNSSK